MKTEIKKISRFFNPVTIIGIFVTGFLISLIISGLLSYNLSGAISKGLVLTFSGALYFLLTRLQKRNLSTANQVLGFAVMLIALFFIFTHDWTVYPVDIGLVNKIAVFWMRIRPRSISLILNEDIIGGVVATFIPLLLAQVVIARKKEREKTRLFPTVILLVSLLGLFMTASRPAWFALIVAGILISIYSLSIHSDSRIIRRIINYTICLIPVLAGSFTLFVSMKNDYFEMPIFKASESIQSRFVLYQNTYRLIEDFFFTGSGLSSFPGIYSKYILDIPNLYQSYAHNIYLDIWVEQGPWALLFFMITMVLSIAIMLNSIPKMVQPKKQFGTGILAGLIVIAVNGILEDPLYGINGTIFLFVLPGLAVSLAIDSVKSGKYFEAELNQEGLSFASVLITAALSVGLALSILFNPLIKASVEANLGAIQMEEKELMGWPDKAIDIYDTINLYDAQTSFELALKFDPYNRTANQRLGMIEFRNKDYKKAVEYLEVANRIDQIHPGIKKQLAYSYTWEGNIDRAVNLFKDFPEAKSELQVYSWWWNEQGENQLAQNANDVILQLLN